MMEILLEVKHLKKYFPVRKGLMEKRLLKTVKAVDDVNFKLFKGETLGIVGESGCGKSTMGKCLIGLLQKTDGCIEFEGREIGDLNKEQLRELKKDMQIIFQDPYGSLNPRFRVREIIEEPMIAHGVKSAQERRQRAEQLLCDVGLGKEYMERWPHEFSGGTKGRESVLPALWL